MLWAETPAAERAALFSDRGARVREEQLRDAGSEPDLWVPLFALALLADEPTKVDLPRLVQACRRIASWADSYGKPGTRLAFVQASALLRPHDAALATEVARLARDRGEIARAESWFRHAVRVARNRDWEAYTWAYVGLGVLYIRSGNRPAAATVMQRALRTAERHRVPQLLAAVHHHLFHLSTEAGLLRKAYEHARAALEHYGPANPAIFGLVADVGRFWLHVGEAGRALPLFVGAVDGIADPNIRAMVAANVARAAAAVGDRAGYEVARERALELMEEMVGRARLEDALEALAYADLAAGEWDRAADTAQRAFAAAQAAGNKEVELSAEALEDQVRARASAPARTGADARVENPVIARQAERLAGVLAGALAGASA
jgi:tetratricopeptide (TPR) repeat protein